MLKILKDSIDRAADEYRKLGAEQISKQLALRDQYAWQLLVVAGLLLLSARGVIVGQLATLPSGLQQYESLFAAVKNMAMYAPMLGGAVFALAVYRAVQAAALHRVHSDRRLASAVSPDVIAIDHLRMRALVGPLSVEGMMVLMTGYAGFLFADDGWILVAGGIAAFAVEYLQGVEKWPVVVTPAHTEGGFGQRWGLNPRIALAGGDVRPVLKLIERAKERGRGLVLTTLEDGRGQGLFAAIQGIAASGLIKVEWLIGNKCSLALSEPSEHRFLIARSFAQLNIICAKAAAAGCELIGDPIVTKTFGGTFHYQKIREASRGVTNEIST